MGEVRKIPKKCLMLFECPLILFVYFQTHDWINLATSNLRHHYVHLALDVVQTHDLPIVSQVLYHWTTDFATY